MILQEKDRYREITCPHCSKKITLEMLNKQGDQLRKRPLVIEENVVD